MEERVSRHKSQVSRGDAERKNTGEVSSLKLQVARRDTGRKDTAAVSSPGWGVRMGTEFYGVVRRGRREIRTSLAGYCPAPQLKFGWAANVPTRHYDAGSAGRKKSLSPALQRQIGCLARHCAPGAQREANGSPGNRLPNAHKGCMRDSPGAGSKPVAAKSSFPPPWAQ